MGLTPKQRAAFDVIAGMVGAGERVTRRALAARLGHSSSTQAGNLLFGLVERGWLGIVDGRYVLAARGPDGARLRVVFLPVLQVAA